ncbi:YdgA family protein [Candidatus Regiella endosymbiont of Tuberolachnus salignus]|uniref:YdgA family protein n=1 Tax=Candidatus Regiella endosymbiont of Tuberolachnus salignus TaxID=3077956 RepID=UPI0030CD1C85
MKKSLVAISIMAIVGSAWIGSTWYMGKLIEQRMDKMVDQSNAILKEYLPEAGLQLSYQDYQRGLFSSHFRYVLQSDVSSPGEKWLKEGDKITFIEQINHGPFPLSQLKKFNFIPSMAVVHSELENTPVMASLFEITKGQAPLTAISNISYQGNIASVINISPMESQQKAASLQFSGATINADVSKDLRNVTLDANSDSIFFTNKSHNNQLEKYSLQGLELKSTTSKGKFDLALGNKQLTIKQMALDTDGKSIVLLEGLILNTYLGESDEHLNTKLNYSLAGLKIKENDFGSGKLILSLNRLDGKAMKEFITAYNQEALQTIQQGEDFEAQELSDILWSQLPILLKGNPTLNIEPLSWKNSKGESMLNLNVELLDPTTNTTTTNNTLQRSFLAQNVKKIDATLTIPQAMATHLTMQIALLAGYSPEESQTLAEQQIKGLAAMGKIFKLTTNTDDTISSSFHYADNQIDLNNKKLSLQEFMGLFGLFNPVNEELTPEHPSEQMPSYDQ